MCQKKGFIVCRDTLGVVLSVWLFACGVDGTEVGVPCLTGSDCGSASLRAGTPKDSWCLAKRLQDEFGVCGRIACSNVGERCATGGQCVAADAIDNLVDPERQGHCQKQSCVADVCPLILWCSEDLWCERGPVPPEDRALNLPTPIK